MVKLVDDPGGSKEEDGGSTDGERDVEEILKIIRSSLKALKQATPKLVIQTLPPTNKAIKTSIPGSSRLQYWKAASLAAIKYPTITLTHYLVVPRCDRINMVAQYQKIGANVEVQP